MNTRFLLAENRLASAQLICASCSSTPSADHIKCDSIECPALYARIKAGNDMDDVARVPVLVKKLDREAIQAEKMDAPPEVISLVDSDDD